MSANESQGLSQDDIDAMLSAMSGDAAPTPPAAPVAPVAPPAVAAAAPPTTPAAAPAAAAKGNAGQGLSQSEIDAMLSEMTGDAPAASAAPASAVAPAPAAVAAPVPSAPVPAAAAPAKGNASQGLSQSEIDAMLSEMTGDAPAAAVAPVAAAVPTPVAVSAAAPSAPAAKDNANQGLSQSEIDAMLAEMTGEAPAASEAPKPPTATVAKSANAGVPAQNNIDTLVLQPLSSVSSGEKPASGFSGDIDSLLSSVEKSAESKASSAMEGITGLQPGKALDQEDIDRLLAELGGSPAPAAPTAPAAQATAAATSGTETAPSAASTSEMPKPESQQTLALSSQEIDALVNKHAAGGDTEAGVEMIDQSDIDALVRQMASATHNPDSQQTISEALAKHGDQIHNMLANANDPHATMDALDLPKDATARLTSNTAMQMPGMSVHTGPVVAQVPAAAFRGATILLAAAVFILSTCAVILFFVADAIRGLSEELRHERTAQLVPTEDYHDDVTAALAKLNSPDEQEAAKGVIFLEHLQKRYPEHERDLALVLARYHRGTGAVVRATRDYAQVLEGSTGPIDDPRIYLQYAECLFQQQDEAAATRQVYTLLANEAFYRANHDRRGLERSTDEIARNHQAIQDAYLTLGRMLASSTQNSGGRVAHVSVKHGEKSAHVDEGHAPRHNASSSHGSSPAHETSTAHGSSSAASSSESAHHAESHGETAAPASGHGAAESNAHGKGH